MGSEGGRERRTGCLRWEMRFSSCKTKAGLSSKQVISKPEVSYCSPSTGATCTKS